MKRKESRMVDTYIRRGGDHVPPHSHVHTYISLGAAEETDSIARGE